MAEDRQEWKRAYVQDWTYIEKAVTDGWSSPIRNNNNASGLCLATKIYKEPRLHTFQGTHINIPTRETT